MLNHGQGKATLGKDESLSVFAKTFYEERIEKKEIKICLTVKYF
jgi:hypothetical protein